jgi:multiple sugar transport system substrate-binding protein
MSTVGRRLAALAAVLSLTVVGCGGVGGGGDEQPQAGQDQGEISGTLSTFGFSLQDEIATTRVDTFKKAYPKVQVKVTEGGFDEQQFLSAVASGSPPDLVYVDREIIGTYAARGAIQPLDDCISSAKIDMSQYRPAAVQQVTVDGKVYGIPEFYSVRVMMINNQAVKEAGLSPADVDTSDWSKLSGLARQLTVTKGDKLQRIGFDPKIPEFLPMWVKANGGAMLSDDGKTAQLNDPKVVEALATTAGIVQASGGWDRLKSLRDSFDFFGAKNEFVKDQLGAFPMEDWYLNVLAEASPNVDLTVTPFNDRQGQPITFVTGSAWAIPKGAKNSAAACQFAKTMTEASTWVAAAKARVAARAKKKLPFTGLYSGNKVADEQIFGGGIYKPADNPKFDDAVQTVLGVQDVAIATPPSPAGAEFQKAWQDGVNRVLTGEMEPARAMERAQREAQAALDKAAGG